MRGTPGKNTLPGAGSAHRIALIDKNAKLVRTTGALLRAEGHEVRAAGTAGAAVDLVRHWKPHVVLLDFYLGRETGARVVRDIRVFDSFTQVLLVTSRVVDQPARKLLAELDIQGYHDKIDGFPRLLTLVDAALVRHRALESMNRQRAYLRRILECGPAIARPQPARELIDVALRSLIELVNAGDERQATSNNGLFVLTDDEAGVSLCAGIGQFSGIDSPGGLEGDIARAVREGLLRERPSFEPPGFVIIPLRTREGARGCMIVEALALSEEAIYPCEIHGRQVTYALTLTTVDPLTRLHNRSFGLQRLEETLRLASRHLTSTALLRLDLDHFKHLNATLGHAAGDLALCSVTQVLRRCCRSSDVVTRYGLKEIVVILQDIAEDDAMLVAERLRREVARAAIAFEGQKLCLTLSIGVAWTPPGVASGADLLRSADCALYEARAAGRNTVRLFKPRRGAA